MPRIAIIGILLAVGVAVWLLISGSPSTPDADLPTPGNTDTTPTDGTTTLKTSGGTDLPEMREYQFLGEARALMIARMRTTWTATIESSFDNLEKLQYRTWYMVSSDTGTVGPAFAGAGRGLPELKRAPTGEYLHENDIQVLVFDEVDPNRLPVSFWNVVADRVNSGKMGLYFRPGLPFDDKNQALTSHQALTHPVMKQLIPIETAVEIKGSPTPGVFKEKQLLKPTEAGYEHPATALVSVERGSRSIWMEAGTGEGAIGTRFCYPVQEVKSDAVVLIQAEAGVSIPAVVVSTGARRVLWMGNTDFGDRKTHFHRERNAVQLTLLNHWWVWLSGQEGR